jgi:thymidylate synthase (FAD)
MESQSFGFVRLDSYMADDISVVNSARVSFAKSQQEMDDSGRGLINFLMREKHGTPFEHNSFRFHVKCPVFVAREWFRHRIGSFNEFSARYSEVGEDFFVPYQNDVRSQVGKPGAYEFHMVEEDIANQAIEIINQANISAYEAYKKLIDIGIAKELSRTVLPVGMYTQFYWTVNARSLMNFLSLRLSKTAQLDIRRYAKSVEAIFADKMPVTYKAWVENGMNCP